MALVPCRRGTTSRRFCCILHEDVQKQMTFLELDHEMTEDIVNK